MVESSGEFTRMMNEGAEFSAMIEEIVSASGESEDQIQNRMAEALSALGDGIAVRIFSIDSGRQSILVLAMWCLTYAGYMKMNLGLDHAVKMAALVASGRLCE